MIIEMLGLEDRSRFWTVQVNDLPKHGFIQRGYLRREVSCFWWGIACDSCMEIVAVPRPAVIAGRDVLNIPESTHYLRISLYGLGWPKMGVPKVIQKSTATPVIMASINIIRKTLINLKLNVGYGHLIYQCYVSSVINVLWNCILSLLVLIELRKWKHLKYFCWRSAELVKISFQKDVQKLITCVYQTRQMAVVEYTAICRMQVYTYSRMILLARVIYGSQSCW